jgi:ATP/ADP translocase
MSYVNVTSKVMAALLYLLSQQQWLVFPMMFWVLVNDMFEMAQGKRLIPIIGSWTFIGKILGIGVAILPRFLSDWGILKVSTLTIEMVVIANVLIYLLIFMLISVGLNKVELRKTVQQPQTITENLSEGMQFVREVPMFRYLVLSIMAIGICDIVVEFRFFVVAKSFITDGAEYKQFYSYYLMVAAWVSFVVQGFIAGRILQKLDLKNSFLIQPFIALGATLAMIASAGMWVNTIASLGLKISRNTIDESTGKAFQALIPEERRGRVALFINNYIPAVGYILGSVLAGVIVYVGIALSIEAYSYVYLVLTAFAAVIAVFAIFRMRTQYESSMFNWRLKRRKRRVDLLKKFDEI